MLTNSSRFRGIDRRRGLLTALLFVVVLALWTFHWIYLRADFPNDSPWMDYSKYTDEGWYGKAAMHALLAGGWRVPGDLNTAVALPVWPALEWLVFRIVGVNVAAARGLALFAFGGNLVLSYWVLRAAGARRIASWGGVLLLTASFYLWAFDRLAILEPLLCFWMLASWLLALRLAPWRGWRRSVALFGVGLLACLAVLTKTTAIFLFPALALLVCAAAGWRLRQAARELAVVFAGGLLPWLAYYLLVIRRFELDFHYFFSANQWAPPKGLRDHLLAYWWAAHGLLWVGPTLVSAMLVLLGFGMVLLKEVRRAPLVQAALLAAAGYIVFIGMHNSPQPRYYMVLAYPLVFVTMLAVQALGSRWPWLAAVAVAVLVVIGGRDVQVTAQFALHPEYTMLTAAKGITAYIDAHPEQGNRLLLSISGDEITLMTHLPAICDDFGTDELPVRIERYRPGWYAEWNELDPGTLEDIHTAGYWLQRVAHWHAFDDEDRDDLILYRMLPDGGR